jgi:RNA polymerase sigma factor (sigma-70 family)
MEPMQIDANQLVEDAHSGDKEAILELIELFYERIYAFLRRLTANDADAADLTQKTFAKVWPALPTFTGRSSIGSWMHGIAYHTYVDWRRRDHRPEPRSDDWWAHRVSPEPGPDVAVAQRDLSAKLYAEVDQLPPELRDTVHLHYYQELTLQETADAMSVASSTVKYRLRQALGELEQKFKDGEAFNSTPATTRRL